MNESFNPKGWKRPSGYSNVISSTGRTVTIAGQIGWNAQEEFESDDFVDQVRQALSNIVACLEAADATPQHIVRLTWYITDKREYLASLDEVGKAYRDVFGRVFPTMSMVQVSALMEDRAKVEIEATAIVSE